MSDEVMSDEVKCPYCDSTQITTNKKGYGFGKGLAGGVALGPLGLLAGGIGSKDIKVTCLSCGNSWDAGKTETIRKELKRDEELGKYVGKFLKWAVIVLALICGIAFLYGFIEAMLKDLFGGF